MEIKHEYALFNDEALKIFLSALVFSRQVGKYIGRLLVVRIIRIFVLYSEIL